MWYRAPNLEAAVLMAEQLRSTGGALWFRGQTRTWPLLSKFVRYSPTEQSAAVERLARFWDWLHTVPALAGLATDEDAALAVAQHYGLATNLVDFSTEPKVAAFFATHDPPPQEEGDDLSCIICLNYTELKRLFDSIRRIRPDMPEVSAITVDIPELWRIQAQAGVFLEYPFDTGFERHVFDFDRIVFPTERNPAVLASLIPKEDIYPTQKSDLEVLLDQYFMLERIEEGHCELQKLFGGALTFEAPPDGIEAECFRSGGLPIHESWEPARLAEWFQPDREDWRAASTAPEVTIRYPSVGESPAKILALESQLSMTFVDRPDLRSGPVRWSLLDMSSPAWLTRSLELLWDGLRRWPYDGNDIPGALAMVIEYGMLVEQQPTARQDPELAWRLAEQCIGSALEVEIGLEDGSYTRGFASSKLLRQAVREDFVDFLTAYWRPQIKNIHHILQVASNIRRVMVFNRLRTLFSTQIVPTQVVLRDEDSGKARLYNLTRATSITVVN